MSQRSHPPICSACGYDLRGGKGSESRCPECGHELTATRLSWNSQLDVYVRTALWLAGAGIAIDLFSCIAALHLLSMALFALAGVFCILVLVQFPKIPPPPHRMKFFGAIVILMACGVFSAFPTMHSLLFVVTGIQELFSP